MASRRSPILVALLLFVNSIAGQSNYASQANNIEYTGDGLPEEATLDGKVRNPKIQKEI